MKGSAMRLVPGIRAATQWAGSKRIRDLRTGRRGNSNEASEPRGSRTGATAAGQRTWRRAAEGVRLAGTTTALQQRRAPSRTNSSATTSRRPHRQACQPPASQQPILFQSRSHHGPVCVGGRTCELCANQVGSWEPTLTRTSLDSPLGGGGQLRSWKIF